MAELSTQEQMISQAYDIYLIEEEGLAFLTRNSYLNQLTRYFQNPEENEMPPHFEAAKAEMQDYTS